MITHDALFEQLMNNLHSLEGGREYQFSEEAWRRYTEDIIDGVPWGGDRTNYRIMRGSDRELYVGKELVLDNFASFSSIEGFIRAFHYSLVWTMFTPFALLCALAFAEFEPVGESHSG
jgi:hypothetical protein